MKSPTATQIVISALLASILMLVTACSSTPRPFYAQDSFGGNSPYQKHVPDDTALACEAAQRTLLGDGYTIEGNRTKGSFKGRKAYRISGDRSTFLEMSVVCLSDAEGSTVFANGLITTYDLKKAPTSASIGLSVIGSVSLPIGQSVDSMVKVSDETITNRAFYQRFFASVEGRLDRMRTESLAVTPKVEKTPPAVASNEASSSNPPSSRAPKSELTDLDFQAPPAPVVPTTAPVKPSAPTNSDSPVISPTSPPPASSTQESAVLASTSAKALGATSLSLITTGSPANATQIVPTATSAPSTSVTPSANASPDPVTSVRSGRPVASSTSSAPLPSPPMDAVTSSASPKAPGATAAPPTSDFASDNTGPTSPTPVSTSPQSP